MTQEAPEDPFLPDCHTCAYYCTIGLVDANGCLFGVPIAFIEPALKGLGAEKDKRPIHWHVGLCAHPETGNYFMIQDMRTFGAKCGPMGRLYENKDGGDK